LALLVLFGRRVPAFRPGSLLGFGARMLLAALGAGAALLLWGVVGQGLASAQGLVGQAAYLAAGGLVGGGAFFLAAYLLEVDEIRDLGRQGTAWLRARISGGG
jgi:hypothetical protein